MSNSATPCDTDYQAPLSMGVLQARTLEWVAISSSGDLPNSGIEHRFPTLQTDSLQSEPPGKPSLCVCVCVCVCTQISPFYKDSSYTDLGASSAPDDFIKLITSAKNLVSSKSHSGALGVRIAIYGFLGDN